jgi:cell division protein FtsQ
LVIGLGLSARYIKQAWYLPIEVVTITTKLNYADPEAIKTVMNAHIKEGFFGLQLQQLRNELKTIPWVADANVARCWSDSVKIKIFERQPLAIWQGNGIVDTEARVFFPDNIANVTGLPEFSGNAIDPEDMVETYLLILSALKPIGLAVKKLQIMPDQGWQAMLDNGITIILGQSEIEERLARFVLAYNAVAESNHAIKVVDLRYTNGLAVG